MRPADPRGERYAARLARRREATRYVDPALLVRAANGEKVAPLPTLAARQAVVGLLTAPPYQCSAARIAAQIGLSIRTVLRYRAKIRAAQAKPALPVEPIG